MSPIPGMCVAAGLLLSLVSLSQGRTIFDTVSDSWDGLEHLPSDGEEAISKPPKPPALLEGLHVQEGKMYPEFDSSTFNYTVTFSGEAADIRIIAQVALGTDHEKYKVKTTSNVLEPALVDSRSPLKGSESVTLVEVRASADKHQSVTYYLEVGLALKQRSTVWRVLFELLYWAGILVAAVVLAIFVYALYLAISQGGVTGDGVQN